jgi:hypothetical protein
LRYQLDPREQVARGAPVLESQPRTMVLLTILRPLGGLCATLGALPSQDVLKHLSDPDKRPPLNCFTLTKGNDTMVTSVSQTSARARDLNDQLRKHRTGGQVVMTQSIAALGEEMIRRIDPAVTAFDAFTSDNDPYGKHDFGTVQVGGRVVMFKIDAYDLDLQCASPNPADPSVTCRVMTPMLADEY